MIVNKSRHNKLKEFDTFPKKYPKSVLFLTAIDGDQATIAGTTF